MLASDGGEYGQNQTLSAAYVSAGISLELVEFARKFGEPNHDKIVLDPKGLRLMIDAFRDLERKAKKALDKGGLVVVEAGDTLVTTYRYDSYDRRKARRRKRSRH